MRPRSWKWPGPHSAIDARHWLNSLKHAPAVAPVARQLLARAGIDGGRRPEQLALEEYETLGRILADMRSL